MVDQETNNLLRKNLEISKENNRLLKKIRRGAIFGGIIKLVWIVIMVGIPVYLYINVLEPILGQVLGAAETIQDVGGKVGGIEEQIGGGMSKFLNFLKR